MGKKEQGKDREGIAPVIPGRKGIRLAAAIAASCVLVMLLAASFILLSEAGGMSGSIAAEEIIVMLDSTSWLTDREGREAFSRLSGIDTDGRLSVFRTSGETVLLVFDAAATIAAAEDGILSGDILGIPFTLHYSESPSGEGRSLTLLSGEDKVIYSFRGSL